MIKFSDVYAGDAEHGCANIAEHLINVSDNRHVKQVLPNTDSSS